MPASLSPVRIASIYRSAQGAPVSLPARLAQATPDTKEALAALDAALRARGGRLVLSDLFRSYDQQSQAHRDFVSGRKRAFSPAAGGSLHEAGRAFDVDLSAIRIPLAECWELAQAAGLVPIIDTPDPGASEAWHFECRGSHQRVYDYYRERKGKNFAKPYVAMAASAIVAIGVRVDAFSGRQAEAYIQSCAIRLGADIGDMDAVIGPRTRHGLSAIGINAYDTPKLLESVEAATRAAFPGEYTG